MSLEDRAKLLAEKQLDKLLQIYTSENVLKVYLTEITKYLKLPKELAYSNATAERIYEERKREDLSVGTLKYIKELTKKNEVCKGIFLDNAYAEHSAMKYTTAAKLLGRKDDTIYSIGNEAPKKVGWSETIKDTHPESNFQYNPKGWVDGLSLFEHWDESEAKILFNLKKAFLNREIPIKQIDDGKTHYQWIVKITVRFKGELR